jgi:hypothetical protein
MLITIGISVWFYSIYALGFSAGDTAETSALLNWLYIIVTVVIAVAMFFTFRYYIKNPRKAGKSLIFVAGFFFLLLLTYFFGSDKPLEIKGYEGQENTPFWLRITDMWIYSTALLFVATFLALIGGILLSYFKKIR